MSDAPDVTTLALLNLIRLLAAELVAGEHRDDVTKLINAIDKQLDATPLPNDIDADTVRAGIAHARELLRPYIKRVYEQAEAARAGERAGKTPRPFKYLQ